MKPFEIIEAIKALTNILQAGNRNRALDKATQEKLVELISRL